jgi:5-oxoprolinase (ATP-hydrolysing)
VSRYAGRYDHVFESVTAGIALQTPQLDINTVAAGGGSRLFWSHGMFKVGPDSAGAHPGPACYRKGGPATVTDANLVLGRLVPECFPHIFGPDENEPLDVSAARAVLTELAKEVERDTHSSLSPEEVALGFLRVADTSMCRPIRTLTEARGFETSQHELVVFGGAGGQHACSIAAALGISRVLLHRYSSILSAYGMALADIVADVQMPLACVFSSNVVSQVQEMAKQLQEKALNQLHAQGIDEANGDDVSMELFLHMHYHGSDTLIMIPQPTNGDKWAFGERFIERHRQEFGFSLPRDVCIGDVRLRAVGRKQGTGEKSLPPSQQLAALKNLQEPPSDAILMKKQVYFENHGWQTTPIYRLEALAVGNQVTGPALIIDNTQTILVTPQAKATVLKSHVVIDIIPEAPATSLDPVVRTVDPVQLSVFGHRFMGIAEQMGRTLQKTSVSTNIKERLDFSCAIFSGDGQLVANGELS